MFQNGYVRCSYVLVLDGKIADLNQSPNTATGLHSSSFRERGAPAAADTGFQQRW
jgi:hypothetical protein